MRPKIKNKKPPVNLTIDHIVLKEAKLIAEKEGVSLSGLVEELLKTFAEQQRGEQKTRLQRQIEETAKDVAED